MSLKWSELERLGSAIAQASDSKLVQIVGIIDGLPERKFLDEAVSKVRDRLGELKPARPLSLPRILFNPAEDLLDAPQHYRRDSQRFSRGIIRIVVQIVEQGLGEARCTAMKKDLAGWTTADTGFALDYGARLWPVAADMLRRTAKAAADDRVRIALIGRDEDVLRQIVDLAELLELGSTIERLKADLPPKPFQTLQPHHIRAIEDCFAGLSGPEQITACSRVLLARAAKPAEFVELLEQIRLQINQRQRDILVGEMTRSVLDKLGQETQSLIEFPGLQFSVAAELADRLASSVNALERKRQWGALTVDSGSLDRARREIADFVSANLDRAMGETEAETKRSRQAVAAVATDKVATDREERAAALRQLRDLSRTLKIERRINAQFDSITSAMEGEAVAEIGAALRQGLPRDDIEQMIMDRLRLFDILEGYEQALALREKLYALVTARSR